MTKKFTQPELNLVEYLNGGIFSRYELLFSRVDLDILENQVKAYLKVLENKELTEKETLGKEYFTRVAAALALLNGGEEPIIPDEEVEQKAQDFFYEQGITDEVLADKMEEAVVDLEDVEREDVERYDDGDVEDVERENVERYYDMVNHPKHYNQSKYETIEKMEYIFGTRAVANYCLMNMFKYESRAGIKGGEAGRKQDLAKADWYIDYYDKLVKKMDTFDDIKEGRF